MASSTPTATACSARCTTPRTLSRRPAEGLEGTGALRGSQLAALLAVHDRHQHLAQPDRPPPQASAAGGLRPRGRPSRRPGRAVGGVRLGRALPGRAARARGRRDAAPEARYEQREAWSSPSWPPCSSCPPASAPPDPARGARLLAQEAADSLDTSVASVNSALQLGTSTVDGATPEGRASRSRCASWEDQADPRDRRDLREAMERRRRGPGGVDARGGAGLVDAAPGHRAAALPATAGLPRRRTALRPLA